MRPLLRLRDRGHYRFDHAAPSLYRGLRFVAERTRNGYALHTLEDWRRGAPDPHFVVDARGRILHRGYWTGYTAEELAEVVGDAMPAGLNAAQHPPPGEASQARPRALPDRPAPA